MSKVRPPKGMRDFGPSEVAKRSYILKTIQKVFESYGHLPLETPAMENLETLTGKYGEEGDRLIFKVLNSGDYLKKADQQVLSDKNSSALTKTICDKAMRYDLTIPFARYVAQNHGSLTFPFKRYQIQPVWRADRPQKGRFREFTQCDGDIIGDKSLTCELELLQIYEDVFEKLELLKDIELVINNRKILAGMADAIGESDKLTEMTIAIDKLDKVGVDEVTQELKKAGLNEQSIRSITPILKAYSKDSSNNSDNNKRLEFITPLVKESEVGRQGLKELRELLDLTRELGLSSVSFNPVLARGLDYYTGTIVEVKAKNTEIGSLGGGGRYDDLTGIFGVKDLSGVGVSFGVDRIYLVLEERELFPKEASSSSQVLVVNFGGDSLHEHLKLAKKLRESGISTDLYPCAAKMKKQLKYADAKNIAYTILQGEDEIKNSTLTLKNMREGGQKTLPLEEVISILKSSN